MNAYRLEGNNPNRPRDYPTPDEVRGMMTGGGEAEMPAAPISAPQTGEIIPLAPAFDGPQCERARAQARGRCPTCGRKFACCCQGCTACPQRLMAPGKVSAAWAKTMTALGGTDPREAI